MVLVLRAGGVDGGRAGSTHGADERKQRCIMMRKRQGAALASIGNNAERKEVLELIGFAVEESDDDSLVLSSSVSSERPGRVSFGDLGQGSDHGR